MPEQQELLDAALNVVKVSSSQMKKCLESKGKLMDALKHASTMLSELRTSALGPKQYYELYMAVFDSMRFLASSLKENHPNNHLADLYELSQYAGNLIPRLYLMITVGSVYMSIPDAPVREIMKDMMEMSRGAQHPIRGLFLRHYLSGLAREHLPMGDTDGPEGNLQDSINFILTNFIEMNKLWVRLQHQGHSREREKREQERKELQSLVGTNLVRLSQLDGLNLDLYKSTILPAVLEQVVQCRDVLAQEYLLEVVTQVFPDEFHLRTLDELLSTISKLNPQCNFRQIIVGLIDRLASFAQREAENEEADVREKKEKESAQQMIQNLEKLRLNGSEVDGETPSIAANGDGSFRGIPDNVKLFDVFWEQFQNLLNARPDLLIQDVTALLVSLCNLSLNCYPHHVNNINQILGFALAKVKENTDSTDLHAPATTNNLLALLLAPISSYPTLPHVISLPNYLPLLHAQIFPNRKAIGAAVAHSLLQNQTQITEPSELEGIFDLLQVFIKEGSEQSTMYPGPKRGVESDEFLEEQGWLSRVLFLINSDNDETQFNMLKNAKAKYADGGERCRHTFPALLTCLLQLARRVKAHNTQKQLPPLLASVLKFSHQTISVLSNRGIYIDGCLRLFVISGQVADQCEAEDLAYEFFAQAFTIYEESISDSKAQFEALLIIASALHSTRSFSRESYDTFITKCAVHGSKLLRKPDQCRMIYHVSHLWWATEIPARGEENADHLYRDGKRVLECLQKALRVADGCMDTAVSIELFVEILNQYVYFFDQGNEAITAKFMNGLIELITSNLNNSDDEASTKEPRRNFERTIAYMKQRRESDERYLGISL